MNALFVLSPTESKRLIAKAVCQLPEIAVAYRESEIVIGHGSTNVYVTEEIMGRDFDASFEGHKYLSGLVVNGVLCVTQAEQKPPLIIIRKGKIVPPKATMEDTLKEFNAKSVFIKGANAVDPDGNAGIWVAHPNGGTIGWSYGIIAARGSNLVVPVGLEKLVPSVRKAARYLGQERLQYCTGIKVGMVPIMNAKIVTELEAFHILFDVEAAHVGGGGVSGSEGSVAIAVEGEKEKVQRAISLVESIKGEEPLRPKKSLCKNCFPASPATLVSPEEQFPENPLANCMFVGQDEDGLLSFFDRPKRNKSANPIISHGQEKIQLF